MNYTIKITDKDKMAKSLINMLKELAEDYNFLTIHEDEEEFSKELEAEFEKRYAFTLKHIETGKSWDEIKEQILQQS